MLVDIPPRLEDLLSGLELRLNRKGVAYWVEVNLRRGTAIVSDQELLNRGNLSYDLRAEEATLVRRQLIEQERQVVSGRRRSAFGPEPRRELLGRGKAVVPTDDRFQSDLYRKGGQDQTRYWERLDGGLVDLPVLKGTLLRADQHRYMPAHSIVVHSMPPMPMGYKRFELQFYADVKV